MGQLRSSRLYGNCGERHDAFTWSTLCLLVLLAGLGCGPPPLQRPFETVQSAGDPGYGYTAANPIRIGHYGDPGKAIDACYFFMSHLITIDGGGLEILGRVSTLDPEHEPSRPSPLGIPKRGSSPRGGILDSYALVPVGTSDTLKLYFDIYHKERIFVPQGLVFVAPTHADTTEGP